MKRLLALLLSGVLIFSAVGCSSTDDAEDVSAGTDEIVVFAAASLTESLEDIKEDFEEIYPDYNIVFNFDSSGTLRTQILEGADADIFISAAARQMDELDPEITPDLTSSIDPSTRVDLLENKVVLAVTEDNPKDISSFEDMGTDKVESIALGNEDVPVGQYSEELFKTLGIWDEIQPIVTYGSNVKEVTTWVAEEVVDCGVVYETDALAAGLVPVDEAGDLIETPVIYPAAILEGSADNEGVETFFDYITSADGIDIFVEYGFSPVD